jgi:hypothetical protein
MVTPALSLEIPAHYHRRLLAAPVPLALTASGVRTWDLTAALRLAVVCYLAQSERLGTSKLPLAGVWVQAALPDHLSIALDQRAAVERRTRAAVVRAAIMVCYPNADGAPAYIPPSLAGRLQALFGDLAPSYQETGRYR